MSEGVFERFAVDEDGLLVELLVQPAINYALVHNRVPLVRHLAVTNRGGAPVAELDVRLELIGPQRELTATWARAVTPAVRSGASVTWDDFAGFGPEMARLRGTDEAFPVDYVLTVTRPGRPDVRLTAASSVLAHNEWFNSPALYDTLAAFVQPNTEAVGAVLRAAAQILLERTGSGSIDGYQAGPERAAQLAGAVYEALRHLAIHYQSLPASFEQTGQKVRTTAAVLDGRLGNCIDLSVTYAACLEQAGLRPLIWLTRDHAFAGFLLEEERLGSAVVTETNLLVALVESGKAVPVELTRIGPGVASADFAAAVQLGVAHFRTALPDLLGVVDVHLAHRSGIRPLPARDALAAAPPVPTGTAVPGHGSIDLPAGVARSRLHERAAAGDDAPRQADDSPARIQQWKKALLDLSLRNPLLNLPKRGKGVDLHVPVGALPLLDDLIHGGKPVEIVPQDAISHLHELAGARRAQDLEPDVLTRELRDDRRIYGAVLEQRYRTAMRALQRDARTMEQETGSNYLYLTIGTLVHTKTTGGEAHAPLFLLPVRIEGGTGRRRYVLRVDGNEIATPNYCLVEWLRVKHQVRIPELEQPIRDEQGIDIGKTFAVVNEHLARHQLNYRIDETASLRLLQFSTFQMWRDLTDQWQTFAENPVVRHLVHTTGANFDDPAGDDVDPAVDEGQLHLPIPADGSQMQAIVLAERGYSFVLEGPPGTGKSQTITNLIARALHAGRSVLFVAEKQAALDVVKRRLGQIGLAPFTLDLHGRKQSLNAIRQQLRDALEQDADADDATWAAVEAGYRARLAPLAGYPARLHAANPAGLSAWSGYESVLAYGPGERASVPPPYLGGPAEPRERVRQMLREYPAVAHSARLRPDHPWSVSGCRALDGLHPDAVAQLAVDLEQARAGLLDRPALADLVRRLPEPEDAARWQSAARLAALNQLPDADTTRRATDAGWDAALARLQADLRAFRTSYGHELATFRPEILGAAELDGWRAAAQQAGRRIFGRRKHRQAVADQLTPYLNPGAAVAAGDVAEVLDRLVGARDTVRALTEQVAAVGGLRLPAGWSPVRDTAVDEFTAAHQATLAGRALLADEPDVWALLDAGFDRADAELLTLLVAAWRGWRGVLRSGPDEFTHWAGQPGWYATWQRDGAGWLADLRTEGLLPVQRWAALLAHLDVLAAAGLTGFRDQLLEVEIDPDSAEEAYGRGVAGAALTERLRAGDLEYFDAALHDNRIAQYEAVAGELRAALPEHLPSVLVRRRPFSPTERRGRVADFTAELRRKRGGRSFRELFTSYSDIVLHLTPCVLVSPASAANFLAPNAARFDLVIFDEASQIRVAEAIGAMGRGRAVVIVGDSRQMPPTNVMQASHGDDDAPETEADPVPEDLDSILSEAVESGLPQRWLSWHYRSRDESLIAFSNRYYYDNKLSSLPSPGAGDTAGVLWHRVDGRFDRAGARTNEVEARAVVAEIVRRLNDPATSDESIGVVTFNIQQRNLILDLLEDSTVPAIRERLSEETSPEPIFVKNLENVQGDERDVVLFSLAFSTDPRTGRLPLNFGPLSQVGGERRLNVAITRARRQVILFASFDPADIDPARTTAVGTHHLRAYCEMAAAGVERLGDLAAARNHRRDRIRDEVAAAIRARGHEVTIGYGLSDFTVDIAVRAPGVRRWQVAVMLDGPQWSRRATVADRDSAPSLLRTVMGWPELVRCWLPAWLRDREAVLDRIDEVVARAVAAQERAAAELAATRAQSAPPALAAIPAQPAPVDATPVDSAPVDSAPVDLALAGPVPAPRPEGLTDAGQQPASGDATTAGLPASADAATVELPASADAAAVDLPAAAWAAERAAAPGGGAAVPDAATGAIADGGSGAVRAMVPAVPAPAGEGSGPTTFVPYAPARLRDQSELDSLRTNGSVQAEVREILRAVVRAEGPVEQHRLARLTLAEFGFAKTTEERRASVLALLDPGVLRTHPTGGFAWPPNLDPGTWHGFRRTRNSADRAFEEIAPEEVANAAGHALAGVPSMAEADLLRSTLELLGYRRKTEKIDRLLRYGLELAQRAGRIDREYGGHYRRRTP